MQMENKIIQSQSKNILGISKPMIYKFRCLDLINATVRRILMLKQGKKLSVKDFFSKCEQTQRKLQIYPPLHRNL